ncbi:MAG TPA: LysR family transcriptional regulator [Magnetospirillaceae bacterium]|nr:LysR family transcriptional regulator [Magnetospirillaceae bacterium]
MRPDLSGLQLFAIVARHLNFRRAAAELGLSAPALSERVRDLENRLGARLFNRTTRSVALTEAGRRLLERIGPALSDIGAAVADLAGDEGRLTGSLRINGPTPAIQLRLAPLVVAFLGRHPELRIEVVAEEALVDIVAGGFDAGVRYGESLDADMIAVSLGAPQRFRVVGSPDYFARQGRPVIPEDLAGHRCFNQRFPRGNSWRWEFEKDGRALTFSPENILLTNDPDLRMQAVRAGLGLTMAFEEYCQADLDEGRLVSVLDDWCAPFPGPFLYYPERRLMPAALRAFVDFVKEKTR